MLARVDGMEGIDGCRTRPIEDSAPLIENPAQLRERASRDGFVFFRGLLPESVVLPLRHCVLDFASRIGWLDPGAGVSEARAAHGKRIGYYQDPDWVNLQVHVQNRPEMWALGDSVAIHRALHALESRSSYLYLSTANTCRVFSPHPDMATQPHQDANYVRMIAEFWTAWIPPGGLPASAGAAGASCQFPPRRPAGALGTRHRGRWCSGPRRRGVEHNRLPMW